ncbi:MAG: hypothetical protein ACK45B_04730 [Limisphaerales bacterium]
MRRLLSLSRRRETGSVLLVTLLVGIVIAVTLLGYLRLVEHQNDTVARAQAWNAAMAAAEAGIEEALAHLNPEGVFSPALVNRAANGWQAANGSYFMPGYPTPRALGSNVAYVVRFTDTPLPTLYATGYVTVPALKTTVSRAVELRTTNAPLFSVAMAALMNITMNGNNLGTDSFISTNAAYSTGGMYDPAKRRDNGDVASIYGIINVGNAKIRGDLLTGPTGSYRVGANGLVGDLAWTGPGIQTNRYANDFNMEYPSVALPAGLNPFTPPIGMRDKKIDGVTYQYAFDSGGSYTINGLTRPVYVGAGANVTLHITGNVKLSGGESIVVAPGGKLTIYMSGTSFDLGGGGVMNNSSPLNFSYYGLPSNTSISFSGNAGFSGSIYAPNAHLSLSGGGNPANTVDFSGASVTRSVAMNGHLNFHYDEALAQLGPTILRAFSWREP